MISRRMLLTTGTASIIVALSASTYKTQSIKQKEARAPWDSAGDSFGDPRLDALSYAVLAPNPHNRQPWLIRLAGKERMILTCDDTRLLPKTDPYNRQIVIGLGAFLELLRQASAEQGYRLDTKLFPKGEPYPLLDDRPIAEITFVKEPTIERDPLFGAALERRTIRSPFEKTKPVSMETLSELDKALRPGDGYFEWVNDKENITTMKDICSRGWIVELLTPATHHESTALTRIGAAEVSKNPDGISLNGPTIEVARLMGILTREKINNPQSKAFSEVEAFYLQAIKSAQAFGWLSTDGNSRVDQITAGTGWVRLQLAATKAGLAMHPLSQVLQEFPEMLDLYDEVHDFVGIRNPARIQGLFRYGYANSPDPAPRWPMESRILQT